MKSEKELLEVLEKNLQEFDKVILITGDSSENGLLSKFTDSEALKKTSKKILVMSDGTIGKKGNYTYRRISMQELKWLKGLYGTYEFSDRFQILSDSGNYGNIFNYVENGLMTPEEAFHAVLY